MAEDNIEETTGGENPEDFVAEETGERKSLEEERQEHSDTKVGEIRAKVETAPASEPKFEIEGEEFPVFMLEIGGKDKERLKIELKKGGFVISDDAKAMFDNPEFTTLENPEQIDLVRLKVSDLGFPDGATTDQIYAKAQELGLELCPAEVGPHQRLKDTDQPIGEWYRIATKQIVDRHGIPGVFNLFRPADGSWLDSRIAYPRLKWDAVDPFVFRLPQVSQKS